VQGIPVPSFVILVLAVLVLSCGQTDRITEADDCYTHATTVRKELKEKLHTKYETVGELLKCV